MDYGHYKPFYPPSSFRTLFRRIPSITSWKMNTSKSAPNPKADDDSGAMGDNFEDKEQKGCICHDEEIENNEDEKYYEESNQESQEEQEHKNFLAIFPNTDLDYWLEVSKELVFTKDITSNRFVSKILLENQSTHCISYNVVCSQKDVFHFYPRQGILSSKEINEVIVVSAHPEETMDFGELSRPLIEIAATPIYFNSQTNNQNKLKLLWKTFGSDAFPYDAAEIHEIRYLIPADDSYLDGYNICERASLGNYVARKEGQGIWERGRKINSVDFSRELAPTESKTEIVRIMKDQVKELAFTVGISSCLISELKLAVLMHRMCLATLVMFGGAAVLGSCLPLNIFDFGSNGVPLQDWKREQSPPLPKTGWEWLTNFF